MMSTISQYRDALPAITTDQMREVDRTMIQDLGITLIQMMESAGRHLATLAREKLGGNVEGKHIVVLAGRGNNGGGGLVAARRLANWGAEVCVVLAASPNEYQNAPAHQLAILQGMGVVISQSMIFPLADLILDCLIGYGLRGAPRGGAADLIRQANASSAPIIALDTPSGLDTTTGETFDPCIRADATMTLALPKVGLLTEIARAIVGELYVADISVPPLVYATMGIEIPNLFAEAEIVHIQR
ncbi:MAG: NAD(P)H-hydrate epimerase [Chloroflexi bacterium]|nr:NAD(P)H-hydrate epimerase [Chloroflexota bacterium]